LTDEAMTVQWTHVATTWLRLSLEDKVSRDASNASQYLKLAHLKARWGYRFPLLSKEREGRGSSG